jgi:N-acetyl sugar amidotransferase
MPDFNNTNYQQCTRCVLDTTSTTISFDSEGVCNYCHQFDKQYNKFVNIDPILKQKQLEITLNHIKKIGKNNKYDCILGLSGGVDSTYLAYLAKKTGLRPMAVHFDNGWNSELAVKNIENIISKLGYNLHTYVIDWEEFKDLQLAYLKASVVDIEVPTDQLIFAALNKLAHQYKIKFILSGANIATEYGVPLDWAHRNKEDQTNLKNIYARFGSGKKLASIPEFGFKKRHFYREFSGIETVSLLNYVDYNKAAVKEIIAKELNWKDYGGKHYESVFTRFYQGYILPKKFNVDKRKAHLSALICSGQITKAKALKELEEEPYDRKLQEEDKIFVIKKFGLSEEEFEKIMKSPRVAHEFYGTEADNITKHNFYTKTISLPVSIIKLSRRILRKIK